MAEVINLDELVPEDIEFRYRGETYTLPGDLSVEDVFRMFELFQTFASTQGKGKPEDAMKAVETLLAELLRLFQVRDPDLEGPLPFGVKALPIIMQKLLGQLGINVSADDPPPSPPKATTRTTTRSSKARKARAR